MPAGKRFWLRRAPEIFSSALLWVAWAHASAAFLDTPNQPVPGPLPTVPAVTPGDGLALQPGARQAFALVMGSAQAHANVTTGQAVRDRFYMTYMTGDLHRAIGSPMDTGQADNGIFAAVARHTAAGAPDDLHVMQPDGLHLRAVCDGGTDCRPGHVWGAMIRLGFAWHPGMVLKVRYRSPPGAQSWAPIWFYAGEQDSPGPGGDPYRGFGTPAALYRPAVSPEEIDWNDNYPRTRAGVAPGYQVDFGTPDIYGTHWTVPPHAVYRADSHGWRAYDASYKPDFLAAPFDWSAGFHNLVGNWRGDGSHLVDLFVDGRLVATQYFEYPQGAVGMHLIIGNQAVPAFSPGAATARDNDGMPDGWTIVVQEIAGWVGGVADPDEHR